MYAASPPQRLIPNMSNNIAGAFDVFFYICLTTEGLWQPMGYHGVNLLLQVIIQNDRDTACVSRDDIETIH